METTLEAPRLFTPEELAALPQARYEGEILVAETLEEGLQALEALKGECVLGFDTETRPTFKKGVRFTPSLVQLAGEGVVVLLRSGAFAAWERLAVVLADHGVVKAGVAVRDDVLGLRKIGPLDPGGFVDVGEWAKTFGWPVTGLRNLAASLLELRVSKKARLTNWEAKCLSAAQVNYAATDAWISRELYLRMQGMGIKKGLVPSRRAG